MTTEGAQISLTGHLRSKSDLVRRWFDACFPNRGPLRRDCLQVGPPVLIPVPPHEDWNMVGMALDYRIRYYFAITAPEQFLAARGAAALGKEWHGFGRITDELSLPGDECWKREEAERLAVISRLKEDLSAADLTCKKLLGSKSYPWHRSASMLSKSRNPAWQRAWENRLRLLRELREASDRQHEKDIDRALSERLCSDTWGQFADALREEPLGTRPVGRRLARAAEERLCRACYALACYEAVFRARPSPWWPIVIAGRSRSLQQLLEMASVEAVADLVQLSQAFWKTQRALIAKPAVLNPTFTLSPFLGGADADLVADHCLIDIKAGQLGRPGTTDFYQLLGYVLADTTDRYEVASVGIYFARQPALVTWPLDQFCETLAGRPVDLAATRLEFAELVEGLRSPGSRGALKVARRAERRQVRTGRTGRPS